MAAEPDPSRLPPAAPPGFSDHFFTSASGTELSVRIWPADPPVDHRAPFVIWTHGGGWIGGFHFAPLPWMPPGFRARGYHLVSHNYRLAPQARLDDQVADSLEAVAWCRTHLPSILGPDRVDPDRYVLVGESAGGTLVTLMGLQLSNPPPRAIVNVYGVTDFTALQDLASAPSSGSPTRNPPPWQGEFSEETLDAFLDDRDPANILTDALSWDEKDVLTEDQLSRHWATDFKYTERIRLQAELHMCHSLRGSRVSLRKGIMHRESFDSEDAFREFVRSVSATWMLRRRLEQGSKEYPPTAFLHGTGDVDVPVSQSYEMAEVLKKMGVPVIERYEEGGLHVFDKKYTSADVPGWETYIQPILDFVDERVGYERG